jgi:tRNA modification GTPase
VNGAILMLNHDEPLTVQIAARVFRPGGKFKFDWKPKSHRVYYGMAVDGDEHTIDEV